MRRIGLVVLAISIVLAPIAAGAQASSITALSIFVAAAAGARSSVLRRCVALAIVLVFVMRGSAQDKFEPIPTDTAAQYHLDFSRNFFASPQAEVADRANFYATLEQLEQWKGRIGASPGSLYSALQLLDQTLLQFYRHTDYLAARYAINTLDTDSYEASARLSAEKDGRTAFVRRELINIDAGQFARFVTQEPALRRYRFMVESAHRLRRHTLSLKEEELLGAVEPHLTRWQAELYQKSLDRTTFGTVPASGSDLDVWKQYGAISNSSDRSAREAGFKKRFEGYRSHRDLYAFILMRLIQGRNQISRLRHYKDNPEEVHFTLHLSNDDVRTLFEQVAQRAALNKRWERLRADHIKKLAGYAHVNFWDLTFFPPNRTLPRFSIGEATRVVAEALTPLGPEYQRELAALFDPANGRLDLMAGDHRAAGAACWGFSGSHPSVLYSFNFEGYLENVSTLAHEAGHAVHYQVMNNNRVLPAYVDSAPGYFLESFAIFNALLLKDTLYRREADPARRTYFLEKFLSAAFSLYATTAAAATEQAMYDGVQHGSVRTADDFDRLTQKVGSRYSMWFEKHDELKIQWINIHHYYDDPMYYINYVIADLLALKYYELFTRDRSKFVPHYVALLRNGFDDTPSALLKKFLGFDLHDPKLVADAVALLEDQMRALEEFYAKAGR